MDYSKINELREFPFVKAFLAGHVKVSTFHDDFNVFFKDQYFRNHFGFSSDEITLEELQTLENALKFPEFTKVLKYNVILWRNLLLSSRLGCQVDILDFSTTKTGTHKYIKAVNVLNLPQVKHAKRLFVISAGNYAYSLMRCMESIGSKQELVIIIDTSLGFFATRKFKNKNVRIIRTNLSKVKIEDAFAPLQLIYSKAELEKILSTREGMMKVYSENVNVTNYYYFTLGPNLNVKLLMPHYVLYSDVTESLGEYDYVVCPTGSGEIIYALWNEFMESPSKYGKIKPQIIGIIPFLTHEISSVGDFRGFVDKMNKTKAKALATPYFEMRPIVNYPNLNFWEVNNKEFIKANKIAAEVGLNSEISGSAGLVFIDSNLRKENNIHLKSTDRILIVNTGNGKILS